MVEKTEYGGKSLGKRKEPGNEPGKKRKKSGKSLGTRLSTESEYGVRKAIFKTGNGESGNPGRESGNPGIWESGNQGIRESGNRGSANL